METLSNTSNPVKQETILDKATLFHGNNMEALSKLADNSIDSVVTDPPYGISYLNNTWDIQVPTIEFWKEVYRVLKPGGHVLSFSSARTYHRMTINIELAGFEIRDQIMWMYGQGMPKSQNVGKKVDEIQGNERRVVEVKKVYKLQLHTDSKRTKVPYEVTTGDSEWEGWGTGLKPAHEPIVVARKPFKSSIAKNVLTWSTGGLNIDRCRIAENDIISIDPNIPLGRFPANIIFDEFSLEILDEQAEDTFQVKNRKKQINPSKFFYCPKPSKKEKEEGLTNEAATIIGRDEGQDKMNVPHKLRTTPRKNTHTTVKPVALMRYLIELYTPEGGITLDPFFGSGSSGKSIAQSKDYKFIGIEKEKDYFDYAVERCQYEFDKRKKIAA